MIGEIIRKVAIECVCAPDRNPETTTEINLVRVLEAFGEKLISTLLKEGYIRAYPEGN